MRGHWVASIRAAARRIPRLRRREQIRPVDDAPRPIADGCPAWHVVFNSVHITNDRTLTTETEGGSWSGKRGGGAWCRTFAVPRTEGTRSGQGAAGDR
jgi:hypothetical protein